MSTAPIPSETSRLSFAKVAASAGKDNVSIVRITASSSRNSRNENSIPAPHQQQQQSPRNGVDTERSLNNTAVAKESTKSPTDKRVSDEKTPTLAEATNESDVKLIEAVKALTISTSASTLVVNGTGSSHPIKKIEPVGDDALRRVELESELGTKPPSLDEKSIASGTTFALDEKESLRPDDSASAKAVEDDDTISGRGSITAGSRIGSEAAARVYRAQLYEAPERRNLSQTVEPQLSTTISLSGRSLAQPITEEGKAKIITGSTVVPEGFNLFYRQTPDEKLLEALESAKDRIFLLRLEQDVIEFVRSSKEPFIDLPPCNSFCRMLTHKLADYYHMTHQVDAVAGAVRIFRTPFCRLPPSLTSLSNPPTSGNTPPPATMKIMRRGGDIGPSPSKAMSESGSDGKDRSLSAKEKLSREEREAAYNRARERIFGKEDKSQTDAAQDPEERNEISRSSSVSAKDRTSQSKRSKPLKPRRDDSEGFDSRSQYTPFFPQPQGPTWIPSAQYSPIVPQQIFTGNNGPFQGPLSPQCAISHQHFNPNMMSSGSMQPFVNGPQHFSMQTPQNAQRFPSYASQITTYGSPAHSSHLPPQQWPQPVYQSPFPQPGPTIRGPPNSIPYPFGQLPNTANPGDPKSQHPIPGSFNRHAFNPKTQSFVPGSLFSVTQQNPYHGSPNGLPHHSSPRPSYTAFSPPQQQFGSGMGYNMARQESNNSLLSYHTSPLISQRPLMHQGISQGISQGIAQIMPLQGVPPGKPMGVSSGFPQNLSQGMKIAHNGQIDNRLPNYGNPSTLPPKPPTGF